MLKTLIKHLPNPSEATLEPRQFNLTVFDNFWELYLLIRKFNYLFIINAVIASIYYDYNKIRIVKILKYECILDKISVGRNYLYRITVFFR